MNVVKVGEGFWRWELPHPDWKPEFDRPGGWGRIVASVYAEFEEAVVLIDPLAPAGEDTQEKFWRALDGDVARLRRPILMLVGCVDHGRSADRFAARYREKGVRVTVVGDAAIRENASCTLDATLAEFALPSGLRAYSISGLSPGETAFFLEPWRAAVFADAVIGAGGGRVRVAPPSWGIKTAEGRAVYDRGFRASLQAVADRSPDVLLPSHGEPVLKGGADALSEALTAPPWS